MSSVNDCRDNPPAQRISNDYTGTNLGNSVQAGSIGGDVHSTIENSAIAGGNIDNSRRLKIGFGGFAAVLLVAVTGAVGYKIGSSVTPSPADSTFSAAIPTTSHPTAGLGGVPAGTSLDGPATPYYAMSSFFSATAFDDPIRVCYGIITRSGAQQLLRDFGGDSCSATIEMLFKKTTDPGGMRDLTIPARAIIYLDDTNTRAIVDTCLISNLPQYSKVTNWGKFEFVHASAGTDGPYRNGWLLNGHEPATSRCSNA